MTCVRTLLLFGNLNVFGKGFTGMGRLPRPPSGWGRQTSCHEADHGPFDHGSGMGGKAFVIAVESAPAHQPGQRSFHHPTVRQNLESALPLGFPARSPAGSDGTGRPKRPDCPRNRRRPRPVQSRASPSGRPPGRGSTIDAISAHCASVRSDGYGFGSHAHMNDHIDHMSHSSRVGAPRPFQTRSKTAVARSCRLRSPKKNCAPCYPSCGSAATRT